MDKDIAKPAIVLLVICVIISSSLSLTYALTKDQIAASEAKEANKAREAVIPDAEFKQVFALSDEELHSNTAYPVVTEVYSADKSASGGAATAGYVATVIAQGYGGELTVVVGVLAGGKISGVRVSKQSETPGLGANATKPDFYGQYGGKDAYSDINVVKGKAGGGNDISAISGATITSTAVTKAVAAASKKIHEYDK